MRRIGVDALDAGHSAPNRTEWPGSSRGYLVLLLWTSGKSGGGGWGGEMRLDGRIEPGIVVVDRLPDLDHCDAVALDDGVMGDEPLSVLLGVHDPGGDLVVRLLGHAGCVVLLEDGHGEPPVESH